MRWRPTIPTQPPAATRGRLPPRGYTWTVGHTPPVGAPPKKRSETVAGWRSFIPRLRQVPVHSAPMDPDTGAALINFAYG